jgi:integrase/recombinase XerD
VKLFLSQEQIGRLLELARKHPRDLALFNVALSTGLRISDVLLLQKRDLLDRDGSIVSLLRVKTKKTKHWINRPLREDCRESVRYYLEARKDANPYLFSAESNNQYKTTAMRPMHRVSAHRIYKRYLGKIFPANMLRGASTHTMRRSVAKLISQRAGRVEPATAFLGHASIASTVTYIDMDGFEETANDIVLTELSW